MAADATVKPSDAPVGLRERKKQRRRVTIAAAALRLFERQGFRAPTVAQVAAAAEVSQLWWGHGRRRGNGCRGGPAGTQEA